MILIISGKEVLIDDEDVDWVSSWKWRGDSPEMAAFAYDQGARLHFGEFAYLNFKDPQ